MNENLGDHPVDIIGNVGVGASANLSLAGNQGQIAGQIVFADTVVAGQNFKAGAGWTVNSNPLTGASDAERVTNALASGQMLLNDASAGCTVPAPPCGAMLDLMNLYSYAKAQSATAGSPTGNLTTTQTVSATAGSEYVMDLTQLDLGSGDVLNVDGGGGAFGADTTFIINIQKDFVLDAGSEIALTGGSWPTMCSSTCCRTSTAAIPARR
jgi:hypothetical protein